MSSSGGPRLVKDGMVFGYDTGYTVGSPSAIVKSNSRFYNGRPTVNYVAYNNAVSQASYTSYSATASGTWNAKHPKAIRAYNAQGGDITGYVNTGVTDWTNTYHAHWQYDFRLRKPVVVMDCFDANWKAKSFDCNTLAWTNYGMTTGSKYVISWLQWTTNITKAVQVGVYCKNSAGTNNFHDGFSGGSTTSKNTKPFTWQRVYHTYTVSANHSVTTDYDNIYMYGHSLSPNGAGVTIKIADVQLELNTDTPSPFIPQPSNSSTSSRTSTTSILDLKKTTSIDVTNVSFSTDGLPTFDGSDDKIDVTVPGFSSSMYSLEWVLKPYSNTDYNQGISLGTSGIVDWGTFLNHGSSTGGLYCGTDTATRFTPTQLPNVYVVNKFVHCTFVLNSGTAYFYKNGVLLSSKAMNTSTTGTFTRLLISTSTYGEMPIMKLYNRAVLPSEVQQNYRAYKNRFKL